MSFDYSYFDEGLDVDNSAVGIRQHTFRRKSNCLLKF